MSEPDFGALRRDLSVAGMPAILNNIPSLMTSLAGPGLAAAASLAEVALNELLEHWPAIIKSLDLPPTTETPS